MKPLLILKMGSTLPDLRARKGDFEDWVREGMDWSGPVEVVQPFEGEALPETFDYSGVVITGSAAMITEQPEWSLRTRDWITPHLQSGVPILGICYGHQFLADALGGRVGINPLGYEAGSVEICLAQGAQDDPLLSGMGDALTSQASHKEAVVELPPGAVRLAYNDRDPNQAYRVGDSIWGTQFHPEFDAEVSRTYAEARRERLRGEGLDPDQVLAELRDSPDGNSVLSRFAEIVREREQS